MRTFWLYFIVLIVFCASGLTIGAKNSTPVVFDFLLFRAEVSLAMVMVIGITIGVIFGIYLSLLFSCRAWTKTLRTNAELRRLRKAHEAVLADQPAVDKEEQKLPAAARS